MCKHSILPKVHQVVDPQRVYSIATQVTRSENKVPSDFEYCIFSGNEFKPSESSAFQNYFHGKINIFFNQLPAKLPFSLQVH